MRFRLSVLVLALLIVTASPALAEQSSQTTQDTVGALTNKDILEMHAAGLSEEVVIAKIKASTCAFDSSPSALAELKRAGVSDAVILIVVQASKVEPKTAYVNCFRNGTRLLSSNSYESNSIGFVKCGEKLILLDKEGDYFKVTVPEQGVTGFLLYDYVSETKPEVYEDSSAPTRVNQEISTSAPLPPDVLRAVAWRAVPWVTTTYLQRPGRADMDCTGSGTWYGSIWQGESSCTTQYTPAQSVPVNWEHTTIYKSSVPLANT